MAVIGNSSTQQAFTPAVDYFSGNASTTAFTLSRPVASVAQVQVVVNNVAQNPSSAYTISSNTITFTSAPSSGTNNIYVYYTSPITQVIAPGQNTVSTSSLTSNFALNLTSQVTGVLPVANGGTGTSTSTTYSVSYLVVGGGAGGGGYNTGGGGGGGGVAYVSSAQLVVGQVYTATVGAGGKGAYGYAGVAIYGENGMPSMFNGTMALGGGGGGHGVPTNGNPGSVLDGHNGASGGGGGGDDAGPAGNGGLGYQGFNGGAGYANGAAAGGGGGAGGVGSNAASSVGGNGGVGLAYSITGSSVYYGGGGGGGANSTGGTGGSGGGGNGGYGNPGGNVTSGTNGLGGGGGGAAGYAPTQASGDGGSGVVIISVPTAKYSGTTTGSPTITTSGANTIIKFTSYGTYTA